LIIRGRFSGSKALVISKDVKIQSKKFDNLLLVGIKKYPLNISKKMSIYKISKRCSMKIFIKVINAKHVYPTRYVVDIEKDLGKSIDEKIRDFHDIKKKKILNFRLNKNECNNFSAFLRNILLDKFYSGKYSWFFKKLKF
jgi:large subunit ribosomal protein L27e